MICGSPRITGSWILRAPTKGFWWHLHVGSSLCLDITDYLSCACVTFAFIYLRFIPLDDIMITLLPLLQGRELWRNFPIFIGYHSLYQVVYNGELIGIFTGGGHLAKEERYQKLPWKILENDILVYGLKGKTWNLTGFFWINHWYTLQIPG